MFDAFKRALMLSGRESPRLRQRLSVRSGRAGRRACSLDELSRRLCNRHTGVGGDGVIYYTIAPDGTAQMKLINTDGSPSELSGNGLRCLAALVLYQREQLRSAADHRSARRHRCRMEDAVADQPAGRALHVPRGDGAARARRRRDRSTPPARR